MVKRITIILLLLVLIASLSFYSVNFHPWINVSECLQNPEQYDGCIVTKYSEPVVGEIYSDGFQLLQRKVPPVRVFADTTGLVKGEYVSMKAVFHKAGYLEAVKLRIAKKRRLKIWLSILPVILVCFLLIRYYKINIKTLQIESRKHA